MNEIVLTDDQRKIMSAFYSVAAQKVLLGKDERRTLWDAVKKHHVPYPFMQKVKSKCPALHHQIERHEMGSNCIQSAVFSECVYAQALADVFRLPIFHNCYEDKSFLPEKAVNLLASYAMRPRYAYMSSDGNLMLIQAGGCGGVDSALFTIMNWKVYTIEFKEPYAKTSEPDLPKYGEDGNLVVAEEWLLRYPQFAQMLEDQKGLNFFEVMGSNVHDFNPRSVNAAVTKNYQAKKFADVLCTEDKDTRLVMLPINQAQLWAKTEGEIRPAGRNHYAVWTPNALRHFLAQKGGAVVGGRVRMPLAQMETAKPRGGNGISRYKINSLFFVRAKSVRTEGDCATFPLKAVRQLNPTIAAKMLFEGLSYEEVREHYFGDADLSAPPDSHL